MVCAVVVVICLGVGHVLGESFRVFSWKETTTTSESRGRMARERRERKERLQ